MHWRKHSNISYQIKPQENQNHIYFEKKNEEKQTKTKYNSIFVFNASKKQNNKQTFPKKHSKT
jgi:hypothetical protein